MVYPAFGVVYANGVNGFTLTNSHDRQHAGNRTALWLAHLQFSCLVSAAELIAQVLHCGHCIWNQRWNPYLSFQRSRWRPHCRSA